jgi:hypothetical protein
MSEISELIEDVKESEMSMYPPFKPEEVAQKRKRISELEKAGKL